MQISGIRNCKGSSRAKNTKRITNKCDKTSFDQILQNEIKKLKAKEDNYLYYRCMECVHSSNIGKQICVKCGYCGREFDEDGHLDNIDEYPSVR